MTDALTTGAKLRALKQRSRLSVRELAKGAGYATASGIQRYFDDDYTKPLPLEIATRFVTVFKNAGIPEQEVMALALGDYMEGSLVAFEGSSSERMRNDLPVYGTALGAPADFNGTAIEQTMLNTGEIVEYVKRPVVLNGKSRVYGLYIQGDSMYPRFNDAEIALVDAGKPPSIGEDVVVYVTNGESRDASGVLIKRLVRKNSQFIELEQFNPAITFKVPIACVYRMDRVLPWPELLS